MPPRTNHRVPAIILTAGVLAAAAILISAAADAAPPPSQQAPAGQYGTVARILDDPANPNPTVP